MTRSACKGNAPTIMTEETAMSAAAVRVSAPFVPNRMLFFARAYTCRFVVRQGPRPLALKPFNEKFRSCLRRPDLDPAVAFAAKFGVVAGNGDQLAEAFRYDLFGLEGAVRCG